MNLTQLLEARARSDTMQYSVGTTQVPRYLIQSVLFTRQLGGSGTFSQLLPKAKAKSSRTSDRPTSHGWTIRNVCCCCCCDRSRPIAEVHGACPSSLSPISSETVHSESAGAAQRCDGTTPPVFSTQRPRTGLGTGQPGFGVVHSRPRLSISRAVC